MNCPYPNPADCPAQCPHGVGECFPSTVQDVKARKERHENRCPDCSGFGGFKAIEGPEMRTVPGSRRICTACGGTGKKPLQKATNLSDKEEKMLKPYPSSVCFDCLHTKTNIFFGEPKEASMITTQQAECNACGKTTTVFDPSIYGYPTFEGHEKP